MRKIENIEDLESLTPAERDELLAAPLNPQPWCGTCIANEREVMRSRMRYLATELEALVMEYERKYLGSSS